MNIIYSGGDDIFAVGRWDKVIEFAEDVRKNFQEFVGREDISLSAGLAVVNNKFPIAKAADIAGEAEQNAKMHSGGIEKNAFCFLGETISWKDEYPYVKHKKQEFVSLIIKEGMSKGILHRLMYYGGVKRDNERKSKAGKQPDLGYKWHSAYYLTRFMERYKKQKSIFDFIDELRKELFEPDKYELVALAARWAELELRLDEDRKIVTINE